MHIIVGCKAGKIRVVKYGTDKTVKGGFKSIEDARDWINDNECGSCCELLTAPANGCKKQHFDS